LPLLTKCTRRTQCVSLCPDVVVACTCGRFDLNWGQQSVAGVEGKVYPYVVGEIGSGWNPYYQGNPSDGAYNGTALNIAQHNLDTDFRCA
jgi:hypothetical protein